MSQSAPIVKEAEAAPVPDDQIKAEDHFQSKVIYVDFLENESVGYKFKYVEFCIHCGKEYVCRCIKRKKAHLAVCKAYQAAKLVEAERASTKKVRQGKLKKAAQEDTQPTASTSTKKIYQKKGVTPPGETMKLQDFLKLNEEVERDAKLALEELALAKRESESLRQKIEDMGKDGAMLDIWEQWEKTVDLMKTLSLEIEKNLRGGRGFANDGFVMTIAEYSTILSETKSGAELGIMDQEEPQELLSLSESDDCEENGMVAQARAGMNSGSCAEQKMANEDK